MIDTNDLMALFGVLGIGVVILIVALLCFGAVIFLIARIKMFKKCGKEGWKAIIPFYTNYVFCVEICGLHWAWFVASLVIGFLSVKNIYVSALNLFVNGMSYYNLAIRCKKDPIPSMIFGAIAPAIMACIYGFGTIDYDENIIVKSSGLF